MIACLQSAQITACVWISMELTLTSVFVILILCWMETDVYKFKIKVNQFVYDD